MAFDEGLAERIREFLQHKPNYSEKKMFGGLAFMQDGHMFVGIVGDVLMARVGPDAYQQALGRSHVREMDFTGKPMKGYVFVDPPGFENDEMLENWIAECCSFAQTLPAKPIVQAGTAKTKKAKRVRTTVRGQEKNSG